MTSSIPTLTVFILLTCVNRLLSSNNAARSDGFVVQWIEFKILTCAVPTTMNVSILTCIAPNYTQIGDLLCFPSTTIEFQPSICPLIARMTTYSSLAVNTVDYDSSTAIRSSAVETTNSDRSTSYSTIDDAVVTKAVDITTASATATTNTDQMLISSSTTTTRTSTVTVVSTGITTQSLSTISTANQYFSSMLTRSATQTSAAIPNLTTQRSISTVAAITTTISTATSAAKETTILSSSTAVSVSGTRQRPVTASTTTNRPSESVTNTRTPITPVSNTIVTSSYHCSEGYFGPFCNISSDACVMSQPCLNAATCYPNNTFPLGYQCHCQSGYTGNDCQNDERICKENTCWNNGKCIENNSTMSDDKGMTFYCRCERGYTGIHCEWEMNLCGNITCANKGQCQTINMTWKCTCLDASLFYGDHCQFQTNSLLLKKILSRSFASVAIIIIVLTCSFVVLMDILKYVFHIDPVATERRRYWKRQEEEKRVVKLSCPKVAVRFQYIP